MKAQIQCRVSSHYLRTELQSLCLHNFETDFGGAYAWQDFDLVVDARQHLEKMHIDYAGECDIERDFLRLGKLQFHIVTDRSKFWRKEDEQ
jgi:hypothetical protein